MSNETFSITIYVPIQTTEWFSKLENLKINKIFDNIVSQTVQVINIRNNPFFSFWRPHCSYNNEIFCKFDI